MSLANTSGIDDPWLSDATGRSTANGARGFDRSIRADVQQLAAMRAAVRAWLTAHRVSPDDCDAIVLSCSEAVANAIEHAYRDNPDGIVAIAGHIDGSSVELSVHDSGEWIPAHPVGTRSAGTRSADTRSAGSSEVRGRGLVLITQLMDAAAIDTRDGTTILMRRSLTGRS